MFVLPRCRFFRKRGLDQVRQVIEIDGSFGEGGGQIIRSSLALSLVTGQPTTICNIRAGRPKPGLMRQHLAAVRAAQKVGRARVDGGELRSTELVFRPKKLCAGEYRFSISTAGSSTLVAQTVLPALMLAGGPSSLTLDGGTHNEWAPPYDFLDKSYLPVIRKLGPAVRCHLVRPGFYPAGGGTFTLDITPTSKSWNTIRLDRREPFTKTRVRAIVANLPTKIALRELETIKDRSNWNDSCFLVQQVESDGPGNVVLIEMESSQLTNVFAGFGRKGLSAERVAGRVYGMANTFLETGAVVDEYLADQLLLPLGLSAHLGYGGGSFRTHALSGHTETHIEILKRFLDIKVKIESDGETDHLIRLSK